MVPADLECRRQRAAVSLTVVLLAAAASSAAGADGRHQAFGPLQNEPLPLLVASNIVNDLVVDHPSLSALPTDLEPAAEPSVVDLAVFYGQEFLQRGYSLSELDDVAALMLGFTNDALQTSGVPLTLRITYAAEFDQALEGIDTTAAFSQLGVRSAELRDSLLSDFGVDAVMLIKATDDADFYFGMALLGTEANLSDPATVPHAIVCLGMAQTSGLECFEHGGTFAHEIGHLFGAGHQRDAQDGGTGGAFDFSQASACGGGTLVYAPSPGVNEFYSTPSIELNGVPCGVSASAGPDGEDNAHTIDLTRSLMAALRPTMPVHGDVLIDSPTNYTLGEGESSVSINVRRTGDLTHAARVSVAVLSEALGGPDLRIDPPEPTFEPGQDLVSISISPIDDVLDEPDETFIVGLRNPWQLKNVSGTIELTIIDDDEAPPPASPPTPESGSGGGATGPMVLMALLTLTRLRCVRNATKSHRR